MPSWMAWMQRPSGLIKVEGCESAFRGSYLGEGRECFTEVNVDNRSKSLSDSTILQFGAFFNLNF